MSAARLLVVDDEPSIGLLIVRLFRDFDVTVVSNGNGALELLRTQEFDLILCDLMMPGMSGIELYEQLRETARPLTSRLIFMTAGSFTAEAQLFLARVGNPRVEKPFTLEYLEHLVREQLQALAPSRQA